MDISKENLDNWAIEAHERVMRSVDKMIFNIRQYEFTVEFVKSWRKQGVWIKRV